MSLIIYLLTMTLLKQGVTAVASNVTADEIPESYLNLTAGNELWSSLLKNCRKPSMECVEKNMYSYLQDTLDYPSDFQVAPFMQFKKNKVDYEKIKQDKEEDEEDDDGEEARSNIEEMSRALHDRSIKFLMTHDVEVQLPETIFQSTTLKISPRSLEGNGALVKLEFQPREVGEGRIFLKKIKQYISQKLLYALLAILLVIKLLAAKFLFFMPMMVGAVTAKKLLIKVLLFIFPALHHLFKLCPYVPHGTKYHHHKHQIAHIHHIGGHGHGHGHPPSHHHGPPSSVEVIAPHSDGPPSLHGEISHGHGPSLHHYVDIEPPHKKFYNPHEQELEYWSGGPALSNHFITHRQDPKEDENELQPWGQGHNSKKKPNPDRLPTPSEVEKLIVKAEKEALLKARLQQEKLRIQEENALLQEQLRRALKLQDKLRQQAAVVKQRVSQIAVPKLSVPPPSPFLQRPIATSQHFQEPEVSPVYTAPQQYESPMYSQFEEVDHQGSSQPYQVTNKEHQEPPTFATQHFQEDDQQLSSHHYQDVKQEQIVRQQEQFVSPPTTAKSVNRQQLEKENQQVAYEQALHQAASITYDRFYSPILEKIDGILLGLGFTDEPCRERLICSMYKNPAKFSPHSNLLSAELSRDSKELQKPTTTNAAVVRFYRYVQAARDGQDKRECLRLYASCSLNTE